MSLSIFEYGDGRFRLFEDGREIGWVDRRAIGFNGYDDHEAALRAATVAYDALSAWLARQRREEMVPRRGRRLGTRVEGAERHLTLGGVSIGTLIPGSADILDGDGSAGFELRLPPRIGAPLTAAQIAHNALVRHRTLRELESASPAPMEGSAP